MNEPHEDGVNILAVEDDPITRSVIKAYFEKEGFRVHEAEYAQEMESILSSVPIDLVLLDINLPGKDGLTIARELRARSDVGIILVTSKDTQVDRIVGLEIGADDYVTKPFDTRELLARARTVMRRVRAARAVVNETPVVRFRGWTFDMVARKLTAPDGQEVRLTGGEYSLLSALVQNPGRVMTRDRLLALAHNREWAASDRTIDVQIGRLRRKLRDDPKAPEMIVTVHGEGYVFAAEPH